MVGMNTLDSYVRFLDKVPKIYYPKWWWMMVMKPMVQNKTSPTKQIQDIGTLLWEYKLHLDMLVTIYPNFYASAWWTFIVWYWNSWPSCGHIFTQKNQLSFGKTPLKKVVNWWLICVCPGDFLIGENPWYLDPEVRSLCIQTGWIFPGFIPPFFPGTAMVPTCAFVHFGVRAVCETTFPPPPKKISLSKGCVFFWFEVTEISFKQKLGVEGFVLSGAFSQLAWEQFRLENLNTFITEMNSS